jgi:protein TonB
MLETSMFESGRGRAQTRKPATVLVSTGLHVVVILVLLLVPLAHPQALPALSAAVGLPLPVVAKAGTPKQAEARGTVVQPHIRPASSDLIQPAAIPSDIALISDDPSDAFTEITSSPISTVGSLLRSIAERPEVSTVPEPPPPPMPAVTPPASAPIRVGGKVQAANLVHQILPKYPALARQARVQGAVILEATIDREGTVSELRVISGHPLLIDAALEAVQQWKYKPTILNGEPIDVITTITVTFSFQ